MAGLWLLFVATLMALGLLALKACGLRILGHEISWCRARPDYAGLRQQDLVSELNALMRRYRQQPVCDAGATPPGSFPAAPGEMPANRRGEIRPAPGLSIGSADPGGRPPLPTSPGQPEAVAPRQPQPSGAMPGGGLVREPQTADASDQGGGQRQSMPQRRGEGSVPPAGDMRSPGPTASGGPGRGAETGPVGNGGGAADPGNPDAAAADGDGTASQPPGRPGSNDQPGGAGGPPASAPPDLSAPPTEQPRGDGPRINRAENGPSPPACDATATATGPDVVLALDHSKSMALPVDMDDTLASQLEAAMEQATQAGHAARERYNSYLAQPGQKRLDVLKQAVRQSISQLPKQARVGLVTFAGCDGVIDRGIFPSSRRAELIRRVDALRPHPATPVASALEVAVSRAQQMHADHIILLTDGRDTCGGDPCRMARQSTGIRVDVIAMGGGQTLACIAQTTGGQLIESSAGETVQDILQRLSAGSGQACQGR